MGKACQARRGDSQYDPGDSGVLVIAVDLGLWQLIVRGVVQLPSQIVEERLEPRIEELFGLSIPVGASWEAWSCCWPHSLRSGCFSLP